MRKNTLIGALGVVFALLTLAPCAMAANTSLKDVTTSAMYDYAKQLANRGDRDQAVQVANRILAIDPSHAGARAIIDPKQKTVAKAAPAPVMTTASTYRSTTTTTTTTTRTVNPVSDTNDDLKAYVREKERTLETLRNQVAVLKQQISDLESESQGNSI